MQNEELLAFIAENTYQYYLAQNADTSDTKSLQKALAGMDYSGIDCQKRLIKTFLNAVFVYDDKVVLTFNYSGDNRTMTLREIDAGLSHGICIAHAVVHQNSRHTSMCLLFSCPAGMQ